MLRFTEEVKTRFAPSPYRKFFPLRWSHEPKQIFSWAFAKHKEQFAYFCFYRYRGYTDLERVQLRSCSMQTFRRHVKC